MLKQLCEASQRPNMRFVAIKGTSQQDIQAIHRMRSLAVDRRTDQVRGLLLEFGITIPKGRSHVLTNLPYILKDAKNGLSDLFREELNILYQEHKHLDQRIKHYDQKIEHVAQNDEQVQQLMTIPGGGSKTATALLAAIGDVRLFESGRELSAWIGLVPCQHSTGVKDTLLGISKRGDIYIRQLLIHGARSVMAWLNKKSDRTSQWAKELKDRRHPNIATVVMANKMVRTAYALLKKNESYKMDHVPVQI